MSTSPLKVTPTNKIVAYGDTITVPQKNLMRQTVFVRWSLKIETMYVRTLCLHWDNIRDLDSKDFSSTGVRISSSRRSRVFPVQCLGIETMKLTFQPMVTLTNKIVEYGTKSIEKPFELKKGLFGLYYGLNVALSRNH